MPQPRYVEKSVFHDPAARIKIIGVGGGGGNAINRMIQKNLGGIEFIAFNTDKQALTQNQAPSKVLLGEKITNGLGAGGKPEIGKKAMEESWSKIEEMLHETDMVIITAGMGGGTGTGAAPLLAKNIKEHFQILSVGIVTFPFNFENRKRRRVAEEGIRELKKHVDTLLLIPNDKIYNIEDKNATIRDAFLKIDDVLYQAAFGISEIINQAGEINVDFADVKTILQYRGKSVMGMAEVEGPDKEIEAVNKALQNPLLADSIAGPAKGVLINIVAGTEFSIMALKKMLERINELLGDDTDLIYGVSQLEEMNNRLRVTVIATGINDEDDEEQEMKNNITQHQGRQDNDISRYREEQQRKHEETQQIDNKKIVNADNIFKTPYSKPPGFLSSNMD